MTPRLAAIALPTVRIELARTELAEKEQGGGGAMVPLAVVIGRVGGTVKDERSLLGNTRIDEVSREAYALGVRCGQTIAAARARASGLRVRVVHAFAVTGALAGLAEMALAFGASTSFEVGGAWGDVVWCDITGSAHLFKKEGDETGETTLASNLAERVRAMGHACRVAISDGPRIAAAVARFTDPARPGPLLVPSGKGAAALRRLPLGALPLNEATAAWLTNLGMKRAGDLQRLPRRALGARLGLEAPRVMQLLDGDDRERLAPYVPPEVPEEKAELEYGIEASDALVFVVKRLADRLALRLAGRCMKARRLELALRLDRALLPDDAETNLSVLTLLLPAALAGADDLLRVLRARIESYVIAAPILEVTLVAKELVLGEGETLDLLEAEAKASRCLPRLSAELVAELGEDRVGTLALRDAWLPEERARLVPITFPLARAVPFAHARLLSGAPEPSRVLAVGLPYRERHSVRFLEKIEAVAWWKAADGGGANVGVEKQWFLAWTEERRAMAWVEVDARTNEPCLRGWMD